MEELPIKTKQELLEEIILQFSRYKSPPLVSEDATDEEKRADRERRLNAKSTRWRIIFSSWPRDPKGKNITTESSQPGKMVPNGSQIWGATLFDFYSVRRLPNFMHLVTYSSGSKLAAWMKANGEDYAKSHLEFAEREADPHLILPYDISSLIEDGDAIVGLKSWVRDEDKSVTGKGKGKQKDWQVPQPWPPASPFDALAYPKPWPSEPFTKDLIGARYPKLEAYIPHSHLPKILKVHDPWNVLHAARIRMTRAPGTPEEKWSDKTDIVHTYRLKTSTKHRARRTQDDEAREEAEAKRKAVYDTFIADPHSRNELPSGIVYAGAGAPNEPGPVKPLIFVVLPFQPPIPPAREAHLYLSPSEHIGEGNHSFVYNAEFELPRSTIMEDKICHQCVIEDMRRILEEQDGPNGERRDPKWDEKVGRYVVKTVGEPPLMVALDNSGKGESQYLLEDGTHHLVLEYEGPYRVIHSTIGYQCLERGPYCEHIATSMKGIHPLTAKVKVAAKISIQGDHHLGREAEMYQAFPRHFFEHWSGFNLVKPLKEPTPVCPLVPQFYGHYVPDKDPEESGSESASDSNSQSSLPQRRRYLSPILLLENCGSQLDSNLLTLDDQSEAASLVFRFHDAGWFHGSIAKRNILVQRGPLSEFPVIRDRNRYARGGHGVGWSFRLIDFGRSADISNAVSDDQMNKLIMGEEITIQNWLLTGQELE
ncbi:hypothetical protein BYT27DRAFT_7121604 [Phlegmacium glaucopus]|nr:hypothetical protein BYT27DRAFT_7121604 [Phlegmacium glaucopus]